MLWIKDMRANLLSRGWIWMRTLSKVEYFVLGRKLFPQNLSDISVNPT
jgi:hypothetical protein